MFKNFKISIIVSVFIITLGLITTSQLSQAQAPPPGSVVLNSLTVSAATGFTENIGTDPIKIALVWTDEEGNAWNVFETGNPTPVASVTSPSATIQPLEKGVEHCYTIVRTSPATSSPSNQLCSHVQPEILSLSLTGPTQVTVTWTQATANDPSGSPGAYIVERVVSPGQTKEVCSGGSPNCDPGTFIQVTPSGPGLSHTDTSVVAGTEYCYEIQGIWNPPRSSLDSDRACIIVDNTPPEISHTIDGTLGDNGWFKAGDVTVTWTVSDPESAFTVSGCGTQIVSSDTSPAGIDLLCSATSAGGTTTDNVNIKRDTAAPTTISSKAGTTGTNGWFRSNVDVTLTATDASPGSGVASITYTLDGAAAVTIPGATTTVLITGDAVHTLTYFATDNAGDPVEVGTTETIKIDTTAPTLVSKVRSPLPNANGWHNTNVDVTFTTSDNLSGLDALGTLTATETDTLTTEGADQSTSATFTDQAGNSASATESDIDIDLTAPFFTFVPSDDTRAAGDLGTAIVEYPLATGDDTLSGVDTLVSTPLSGSVLTPALYTITHLLTDMAGNIATDSHTENVFAFILETSSPININAGVFVLTKDEARDLDETVSETVQFRVSSANGDTAARNGITVTAQATGPTDFTFRNAVDSLQFVESATTNTAVNVGGGGYDDITFVYESTHGVTKALRATTQVPGGSGRTVDADDPIRWSSDTFVIESTGAVKIFVASAQNNDVLDPDITATVESLTDPTPHEVTLTEDSPDAGTFTTPTRIILTASGPSDFTTDPANPKLHVSIATDEIIAKYPAVSPTIEDRASIITPEIPVLGNVLVYTTAFTCGDGNDNDNDGLCNSWETQTRAVRGIKVDIGNGAPFSYPCRPLIDDTGVVNTGLYSTNQCPDPNKKDIYVEIDYMIGHKPSREALAKVIDAFRDSPISNGVDAFGNPRPTGATLHIQLDESLGFHRDVMPFDHEDNPLDPNDVLGFKQIKLQRFGLNTERNIIGQTADFIANSLTSKRQVFHYTQFIHLLEGRGTSSGYAELGGNDVVVSLGAFDNNVGTVDQQASTLMHELGHNLGLNHGGSINDEINCKPNYLSIMSYTFQFDDIVSLRKLDFSRSALPTLVESALSESAGIGAIDANGITKSVYGPVTGVEPFTSRIVTGDLSSVSSNPINWDRDEFSDESGIGLSINNIGIDGCTDSALDSLTGYDDWDSMALNFRPSDQFSDGRSTALGQIAERVVFNTAAGDDDLPGITSIEAPSIAIDKTTAIDPKATFEDGIQRDPALYTATWNWGDGFTSEATVTTELADPARDSNTIEGEITLATGHNYANPGLYTLSLTLDDGEGNVVEQVWPFVIVVFDKTSTGSVVATASLDTPAGAFKVFNSAAESYTSDFTKTGKVEFKFQGQWQKNPQEAKINIVLDFKNGPLRFVGTSSEWVMTTGNQGFLKGAGTINKAGDFGIVVSVVDGNLAGGNSMDKVRVRIFDPLIGDEHDLKAIVYDNMCTDPNDVYTPESCVRLYESANDATITTSGTVGVKP